MKTSSARFPLPPQSPIISHTKASLPATDATSTGGNAESSSYFTTQYGYQGNGQQQQQEHQQQQATPTHQANPTGSIYIQSGGSSVANTQTTTSGPPYASSTSANTPQVPEVKAQPVAPKPKSNVDLLSDLDIDCSASVPPPMLPQPVLQPQVVTAASPTPPASQVSAPVTSEPVVEVGP